MKVGILCAGDREVAPFLPMLANVRKSNKAMLTFYEGTIEGVPVVTLFSGVCKVNAAVATQILIDSFGCDRIINAGTAGGMDESLAIFDTVIATETAHYDVDDGILTEFHPWIPSIYFPADPQLLSCARAAVTSLPGDFCIRFGRMVTGERFIADEFRPEINGKYAPLSVDMETAAVAQVCYVNQIPFLLQ